MMKRDENYSALILRMSFALMMIPHGVGKLFGIWGGFGFNQTMHHFTENLGIPFALALCAICVEFFSSLMLLVGFQTRINALLLSIVMLVAGSMHLKHGFYMNWFGQKTAEGFEFHILALGIVLALVFLGGGKYSLDAYLHRKDRK